MLTIQTLKTGKKFCAGQLTWKSSRMNQPELLNLLRKNRNTSPALNFALVCHLTSCSAKTLRATIDNSKLAFVASRLPGKSFQGSVFIAQQSVRSLGGFKDSQQSTIAAARTREQQ
jgi:hypothetical protein